MYRIKGTSGAVINQSYALEESLMIGSADDCDVRIDSEDVRPHHCRIIRNEDGSVSAEVIEDASLRINGESLASASLSSGDEIAIGPCRFLLQAPGLRPDRVLTEEAVRQKSTLWKWLVPAAAAAVLAYAWYAGWIQLPGG